MILVANEVRDCIIFDDFKIMEDRDNSTKAELRRIYIFS